MYPYLFWQVLVKFHMLHIDAQWDEINFEGSFLFLCSCLSRDVSWDIDLRILGFYKYLLKMQVQENKDHLVRWKDFTSLCGTASQLMNDMKTSHWQWEKALFVARDATPMMTLNCLSEQEHLMIAYLHCLGIAYKHNGAKVILKYYCENHDCTKHFQIIWFFKN